jgi:glutaredoxin 3
LWYFLQLIMGLLALVNTLYCRISATFLILFSKVMGVFSSKLAIDMSSPKAEMVKDLIKSDTVVIFSKSYCPYCNLAKEVFDSIKQKFTAIELDKRDDCEEIQAILGEITGAKTVGCFFFLSVTCDYYA